MTRRDSGVDRSDFANDEVRQRLRWFHRFPSRMRGATREAWLGSWKQVISYEQLARIARLACRIQDNIGPGTMRVFAFIDTNILLHYQFFRDVNWAKELRAEEATLVFAPVVVEELDKWQWAGARRERVRAKKVLKALKALGLSTTPVAMRPDVKIMALDEEPADDLFARHSLQPRVGDDRLLASVLAFRVVQGGAEILVLTADTGLSIKAPTRQIAVVEPDERLQRNDEPDETERKLETARRELAAFRSVAPCLKLTLTGEKLLEYQVRRFGEFSAKNSVVYWTLGVQDTRMLNRQRIPS